MKTRVGYAGGTSDKPTYRSIGDHTEAIQIEFDPKKVSFTDLLEVFWAAHDPYGRHWSTQYKAVLWTHGSEQAREAKAFVAAKTKGSDRAPTTAILAAPRFWIAEDYHQKYYLRSKKKLVPALLGEDWTDKELLDSTVAARANGWITGHGTPEEILAESEALKLDEKAREALADALGDRAPVLCR